MTEFVDQLTPARYVDLQVNGYAGVDFNDESITDDQLVQVCERLRADGVGAILATIITARPESMIARIERVVRFLASHASGSVIAGLHIEGPFINPQDGYVGAHPKSAVMASSVEFTKRMLDAGDGRIRLVTLAPEMDKGATVTRYLSGLGVIVSAGHSEGKLADLEPAIDAGLGMWTHLGNGCPAVLARHDNVIQRVLSLSDRLTISFIADGHHVPPFALRNYLRVVLAERVVIVSDAMLAAGLGPGRYRFADQTVEVDEDGAAWAEGRTHLAGSAATLHQMEGVLRERLGAGDDQIHAWMHDNPARLLGLSQAK